jgi:hypothetical protein
MKRLVFTAWLWFLWLSLAALVAQPAGGQNIVRQDGILFGTVFGDLSDPEILKKPGIPENVKSRIRTFQERAKAFRSGLAIKSDLPEGPERYAQGKRLDLEKGMVALIPAKGVEQEAKEYAEKAELFYEWEGMSDSPRAEAKYAEDYLDSHPMTLLRSYINLFLAHRYRCVFEIQSRRNDPEYVEFVYTAYRQHLGSAQRDPDPLVRFIAYDIDRRPFLYWETTERPPGAEAQEPSAVAGCPETATREPVAAPRAWALRCFALSAGTEASRPDTLEEFEVDFDHDGVAELFIGSTVARGNAGGLHYVFRKEGDAYRYLGALFLHPDAFRVLERAGNGEPRMVRYVRQGAGTGLLETITYAGKAFVVSRSEQVSPQSKEDGPRLTGLFGPAFAMEQTPDSSAPPLSVRKAIELAEAYAKENKVDVSGQYIHSVVLLFDERSRAQYWHVQWMWTKPAMGGEFGLRVYMDEKIVPERLGP